MSITSASPVRSQAATRPAASGSIILLGRLLFAMIFILSGPRHFMASTIAYAAAQGAPMSSIVVPVSGLFAFLGGLSILLGLRARVGAWLIVIFLAGATPIMHKFWGIADPMMAQMQMINFMKNVSMLGGALIITQLGSGPWSLDGGR